MKALQRNHVSSPSIAARLLGILFLALAALPLCAQTIQFNTVLQSVIEERLRRVVKENTGRKEVLQTLFEESGCRGDRLTEQTVKGSRIPNVICSLPGTEDQWIVVGAHFDKAPTSAEGAVDNWSGASLLPSLFQSLSAHPRRFTFVFLGFTDEERGLVGSKFYVSQIPKDRAAKLRAMVNVDSLGLSGTKVWVSRADKELIGLLPRIAQAVQLPVEGISVDQVGNSDSYYFTRNKIPVIDFHSITQETLPLLHSPKDTLAAIRLDDYYATFRLITAYLAFLDVSLDSKSATPEAR